MNELIEALNTIKEECSKHRTGSMVVECINCPMGTNKGGCCVIDLEPCNWNIEEPDVVRVMK